jgi:hypothetical protein
VVDELVGAGVVDAAAGGADKLARVSVRHHRALAERPARRPHRARDRRRRPVRRRGRWLEGDFDSTAGSKPRSVTKFMTVRRLLR